MESQGKGGTSGQFWSAHVLGQIPTVARRVGFSMLVVTLSVSCRGIVANEEPEAGCPSGATGEGPTLTDYPLHNRDAAPCPDAALPDATTPDGAAPETSTADANAPDASAADATPLDGAAREDATAPEASADSAGGNRSDGPSDSGVTCQDPNTGLSGILIPAGTSATASAHYLNHTPDLATDGNINTGWNAGDYTGWIELTFPSPLTFDGIQLVATAAPTASETYTLTGFQGSTSVSLGAFTDTVQGSCSCAATLPPMLFMAGAYDAIRIDIQGGQSWAAINEISILTASCPGGDAGISSLGSGPPPDAGGQDATVAGGEAGAPTDAGHTSPSGCSLANTLPLSGTATVTGTERVIGSQADPMMAACFPLVSQAASADISFSIAAMSPPTAPPGSQICSFSGIGSTTVGIPPSFDGDTYTCSETFGVNSPSQDKALLCPELGNHQTGVVASATLKITLSTGAVSVVRDCDWGSTCPTGEVPNFVSGGIATEYTLSGFVDCPVDAGTD